MEPLRLLHIGCGGDYRKGFINTDKDTHSKRGRKYKLDMVMELSEPWPFEDNSIDGIISMGVLQQLHWRELIFALRESYRVLKKGGVMRMGVTALEKGKVIDYILGWNNINVFSYDLLRTILTFHIGFTFCWEKNYKESSIEEFKKVDNKQEQLIYVEVMK